MSNFVSTNVRIDAFHIQSNFDWICSDRTEGVFVCVCLSVCVISTAQTDGLILIKLSTDDLAYIC